MSELVNVPVWAQMVVSFLVSASLKAVVLLALTALIVLSMKRASAAARHLVWTMGVLAVLLVPPLTYVLPAWRISLVLPAVLRDWLPMASDVVFAPEVFATPEAPMPAPVPPGSASIQAFPVPAVAATPAAPADRRVDRAPSRVWITPAPLPIDAPAPDSYSPAPAVIDVVALPGGPAPFVAAATRVDWALLLTGFWLGGMLLALASLLVSMVRVFVLRQRTRLVQSGPCVDAVERVAQRLGMQRVPRLHVGDERMMPMVWGLFRPVLLLPAGAARWSEARLEAVLLHELAHVRRRDALTQFLAELARAIYWFNPLVWLAARRLYLEREHACDDIVLNAGTRASDYAGELLDLVRSLRATRATGLAAIAMARPSQLKLRLNAVLDDARSRRSLSRAFASGAAAVTLLFVLPLAALRPTGVGASVADIPLLQFETPPRLAPGARVAPAARRVPPGRPAAVAPLPAAATPIASSPAAQQEPCLDRRGGNNSINHNSDDESRVESIRWSRGRCSGSARIEGTVRFTDNLDGILSLSSGGLFRLEEDDGETERRLEVRPASGGRLEYRYRVDGRDREFDSAGRAWFKTALLTLVRTTGMAADQRVDQLMRQGGINAVLEEVGLLRSDYVKSLYLRKTLERSDLSAAQVKASVDVVGREISSDYERARVLITLANKYQFTDETRSAFIAAASDIDSDYEQRRVLSTALNKGTLRSQDVTALLSAAQSIGSDYERASLLVGLAEKYRLDPAMRTAYLRAAQGIDSDYEQRRVYANLMKQGGLSASDVTELLNASASISSDYEKAQVLTALAANDLSQAATQRAFITAMSGIKSDYEHRRVLTSLLEKERLSPANLDVVLQSATGIQSDYELAQVLTLVLKNHTLTEPQKELFLKALNTIDSQYEYGRVATALLRQR